MWTKPSLCPEQWDLALNGVGDIWVTHTAGTQAWFFCLWNKSGWTLRFQGFPMKRHWALFRGKDRKDLSRFDATSETRVGTRHLKFSPNPAAVLTSCIPCITLSYVVVFTSPHITWHYFVYLFICYSNVSLSDQNTSIWGQEPYLFCSQLGHQLLE